MSHISNSLNKAMTLTLDITDDLKPDELGEMVDLAMEDGKPMGVLVLEASRELVRQRREQRQKSNAEVQSRAA